MKKSHISRLFVGAAIFGVTLVSSCKNEDKAATPATQTPSQNSAQGSNDDNATAQLNPEHGLPGHRCDLPVGAPLNSTTPAQTIQAENNVTPSSTVSPIRVDKTPAVNPPHGEPGHDCALPVGAPLK